MGVTDVARQHAQIPIRLLREREQQLASVRPARSVAMQPPFSGLTAIACSACATGSTGRSWSRSTKDLFYQILDGIRSFPRYSIIRRRC